MPDKSHYMSNCIPSATSSNSTLVHDLISIATPPTTMTTTTTATSPHTTASAADPPRILLGSSQLIPSRKSVITRSTTPRLIKITLSPDLSNDLGCVSIRVSVQPHNTVREVIDMIYQKRQLRIATQQKSINSNNDHHQKKKQEKKNDSDSSRSSSDENNTNGDIGNQTVGSDQFALVIEKGKIPTSLYYNL